MGHKSLETTMRYLVPSQEVHARLDQVTVPGLDDAESSQKKVPARELARPRTKALAAFREASGEGSPRAVR